MAGINKVFLVGHIGSVERHKSVVKASLATSQTYKDKTGETQQLTEWHRLTFFGKLADIAEKYLKKGTLTHIEGKIQYGKYTAKDGSEKYTTDIIVKEMQMLGSKSGDNQQKPESNKDYQRADYRQVRDEQSVFQDDEIPDFL